jgi:hypothetical protein
MVVCYLVSSSRVSDCVEKGSSMGLTALSCKDIANKLLRYLTNNVCSTKIMSSYGTRECCEYQHTTNKVEWTGSYFCKYNYT